MQEWQPSASLRSCDSTRFNPAVSDSTALTLLQIEDILVADKQLAREIMYDLRQDEQRAAAAAAGQTCAPGGGGAGAGPSGQGTAAQSSEGPSGSGQPAQQSARPRTDRRQERSRAGVALRSRLCVDVPWSCRPPGVRRPAQQSVRPGGGKGAQEQ